jgi:mono/diheme cytochrome c family protein
MRCTALSISKSSFLLPAIALLVFGAARAQSPTYKMGRAPTEAELRAWDNIVGSDGKELPPGSGTAKEGAKLYAAKCASCHGENGERSSPNPRLVGGVGTLNTPTPIRSSGSIVPFATTIWDFINRSMPVDAQGTLSPNDVYAVTAFILFKNGIIKETDVLDKKSLVEVQMPNRNGFYPNPPQSSPDKNRSWLPYWNQAKPASKPAAK